MIKAKFETTDGTKFSNYQEAIKHENATFKEWLETNPAIDIKTLLDEADNSDEDERHGTNEDFVLMVARWAYERKGL